MAFGRNTQQNSLLQLVNNISALGDKIVLGVFLDLTKAFDTNHKALISKFNKYGVQDVALKWLINYLDDREQFVSINGCISKKLKILFGVPQGSILSPLLFLIYTNDLAMPCTNFLPILYADDTDLIASYKDFKIVIECINEEMSAVYKWFQLNTLTLYVKKCKF